MKYKIPIYSVIAVLIVGLLLFLMSLDDGKKSTVGDYRPAATGADGELVLVVPKESPDREVGDSVASFFQRTMPALPPPSQPYFDIVRMGGSKFGGLVQEHRNIFMVDVSEDHDHAARIGFKEDQWAKGQLLFRLTGNDVDSVLQHFRARADRILARFEEAERERMKEDLLGSYAKGIQKKLEQEHGVSLKVPEGFDIKKSKDRFVWLERYRQIPKGGRKRDLMEGLLVYYYPYEGGRQFDRESLLKVRDSVLEEHVPGPSEGSYMATEDRYPEVEPLFRELEFNGEYAAKMRGLWRVENDFMGGPFISLSTYDEARDRLVTVEGFVYGPRFDKRRHIRKMEAILYTLGFPEPPSS